MFNKTVTEAYDLVENDELVNGIVTAMHQTGHRWHDTPADRTPNKSEVKTTLTYLTNCLVSQMTDNPHKTHMNACTGGITVSYVRWESGSEEIRVFYAPVSVFRSVSAYD